MAVALRGTATTGSTTVTAPTGVSAGDLLIVVAIAPSATTITVPAGWTTVRNVTASNTSTLRMVIATMQWTTGSSWTFTGATYNVCSAYSGTDATTPLLIENYQSGTGATLATPTVTNTASGAWRVCCWAGSEVAFSSAAAWSTFSPTDTRRAESHSTQYTVALTDSATTISSGNTSVTGTTPITYYTYSIQLAWIGIIQPQQGTAVPSGDTGSGADSATAAAAAADTAAATETASVRPAGADTAAAADTATVTAAATETGTATDAAAVIVTASDTAAAAESSLISSPITSADTAAATESAKIGDTGADTAAAVDAAGVAAAAPGADTAAATESATVAQVKPTADTAAATESALVLAGKPVDDPATAVDTARIRLGSADTATAVDTATVRHAGQAVPGRHRTVVVPARLPVWTGRHP